MPEVLAEVRRLRRRFAPTATRRWEPCTAAVELQVQIGHLALCLLRERGADVSALEDPHRPLNNLGDELADIVLSALSVAVLAGAEPSAMPRGEASNQTDALLHLLVASGVLSEVTLIDQGYRHRPPGRIPPLPEAAGTVIAACEELAGRIGIDLLGEFRSMVADADAFLDSSGGGDG